MFIINSAVANTDWETAVDEVQGILKNRGAEILQCEKWEERKFAYIISGQRRGVYLLVYFNAPPESIVLVKQDLKLSENVLRSLLVKVDKIKEPPVEEAEIVAEVTASEEGVPEEEVLAEEGPKEGTAEGEPAPIESGSAN
ncbi:MAG: 30S ribosomal protein S6 [Candidatus Scalindua sp. SCAELEC01]|nr:30S ribosomal protein S6 [Planctomycetota bacterium]RZV81509.1 MAG: 30S ribosomal protein S6 [Candidatus Scalindua sp. SCAELEC01]